MMNCVQQKACCVGQYLHLTGRILIEGVGRECSVNRPKRMIGNRKNKNHRGGGDPLGQPRLGMGKVDLRPLPWI